MGNSLISLGCEIGGTVINSVLSSNVVIEEGARVIDSVLMAGSVVRKGATVCYSIVDENTIIEEGATVGEEKEAGAGIAVLGRNIRIGAGAKVAGGQILDKDYKGE